MSLTPIKDLLDEWPRRKAAEDIGVSLDVIHKWAQTDRIPSERQADVVRAAQARGNRGVTADWMVAIHADLPRRRAVAKMRGEAS